MTTQKLLTIGLIALVITVLLAVGGALFKSQDTILSTSSVPSTTTEASSGSYEIINGISVPPEPDPAVNNATLAGVDMNGNGVRDDVERMIVKRYGADEKARNAGMLSARARQQLLVADKTNRDAAISALKSSGAAGLCAGNAFDASGRNSTEELAYTYAWTYNTEARLDAKASISARAGSYSQTVTSIVCPQFSESEIINGISVPPEPDPVVNNSTLAGVDMNENGVRDDVERLIAKEFGMDNSKITELTSFARKQQEMLTSGTQDAIFATDQMYVCGGLRSEDTDKITSVLLNTAERNKVYRDIMANAPDIDIKAEQEACTY